MPSYVAHADMIVYLYQNVGVTDHFGFDSKWVNEDHPGTSSPIEGWKWDESFWSSFIESDYLLSIPPTFGQDYIGVPKQDWKSGIGGGDDLKLEELKIIYKDDKTQRVPVVNHGYYHLYDQEYYLLSDGAVFDRMAVTLDSGSFQYSDLSYIPKVGVPIRIFNYVTDQSRGIHDISREFDKKQYFTPVISSGVALTTEASDVFYYDNINQTTPEFVIRYADTDLPPTVYLNGDYRYNNDADITLSGVSGTFETLGYSTGAANQVFYTWYLAATQLYIHILQLLAIQHGL
jgi:hypothetical protein